MTPVYGITVMAPWWAFIVHADKNVENRGANVAGAIGEWRGRILIAASKGHETADGTRYSSLATKAGVRPAVASDIEDICSWTQRQPKEGALALSVQTFIDNAGMAVGEADIIAVCHPGHLHAPGTPARRWHGPGQYGIVLSGVRAIEPYPVTGGQGFWRVMTCPECGRVVAAGSRHRCIGTPPSNPKRSTQMSLL